jgi:hypothetical protein
MAAMLITRHFVFIHFEKTGGTFLRRLIRDHLPPDWIVAREAIHAGYEKIPAEYAHLPAIAFARNPWDWYVSWYHWMNQYLGSGERPAPENEQHPWTTLLGRGAYDFNEAVTRACTRREGRRPWELAMQAWDIDMFSAAHAVKTGHYPGPLPPGLAHRKPADGRSVEVGRFEHMYADLLSFFERNDVPAPAGFVEAVKSAPAQHTSRRGPYPGYYDDELRELVARSARHMIAEHGYRF